jgi:hypothetical protein
MEGRLVSTVDQRKKNITAEQYLVLSIITARENQEKGGIK